MNPTDKLNTGRRWANVPGVEYPAERRKSLLFERLPGQSGPMRIKASVLEEVLVGLRAGISAREMARSKGIAGGSMSKALRRAGWKTFYLSPEEQRLIARTRARKAGTKGNKGTERDAGTAAAA